MAPYIRWLRLPLQCACLIRCLSLLNDEETHTEAAEAEEDDEEDSGFGASSGARRSGKGSGGPLSMPRRPPPPSPSANAAPLRFDRLEDVYAEVPAEEAQLATEVRYLLISGNVIP